jgi:hypothetical protein
MIGRRGAGLVTAQGRERMAAAERLAKAGRVVEAVFAAIRAANDFRASGEPIKEAAALVEATAMYYQLGRLDRIAGLARRARKLAEHAEVEDDDHAILFLVAAVIETAPTHPEGLWIFRGAFEATETAESAEQSAWAAWAVPAGEVVH